MLIVFVWYCPTNDCATLNWHDCVWLCLTMFGGDDCVYEHYIAGVMVAVDMCDCWCTMYVLQKLVPDKLWWLVVVCICCWVWWCVFVVCDVLLCVVCLWPVHTDLCLISVWLCLLSCGLLWSVSAPLLYRCWCVCAGLCLMILRLWLYHMCVVVTCCLWLCVCCWWVCFVCVVWVMCPCLWWWCDDCACVFECGLDVLMWCIMVWLLLCIVVMRLFW